MTSSAGVLYIRDQPRPALLRSSPSFFFFLLLLPLLLLSCASPRAHAALLAGSPAGLAWAGPLVVPRGALTLMAAGVDVGAALAQLATVTSLSLDAAQPEDLPAMDEDAVCGGAGASVGEYAPGRLAVCAPAGGRVVLAGQLVTDDLGDVGARLQRLAAQAQIVLPDLRPFAQPTTPTVAPCGRDLCVQAAQLRVGGAVYLGSQHLGARLLALEARLLVTDRPATTTTAPPSTYSGLFTNCNLEQLRGVERIDGDIILSSCALLENVDAVRSLRTITGKLTLQAVINVNNLTFPALTSLGRLSVTQCSGDLLDTPLLQTIERNAYWCFTNVSRLKKKKKRKERRKEKKKKKKKKKKKEKQRTRRRRGNKEKKKRRRRRRRRKRRKEEVEDEGEEEEKKRRKRRIRRGRRSLA